MNDFNSDVNDSSREKKTLQDLIVWRRSKVLDYLSKGFNQMEIADALRVSHPTISRDVSWIREHSRENLKQFIKEKLPEEVERAFTSYDSIIKTAWHTALTTKDDDTKLHALRLVKDTRAARMDLVSNVDIINYALDIGKDKSKKAKEEDSQSPDFNSSDEDYDSTEVTEEEPDVHRE